MQFIPPYNSQDFASSFDKFQYSGAYLRFAVITQVHSDKGTVDIEWLDHPGARQDILLPMSSQGTYALPTVGSVAVIGFDAGHGAHILRYLPAGYRDLVGTPRVDSKGNTIEITPTIRKIAPGEQMLISYNSVSKAMDTAQFKVPETTGTYFYMNQVGDIVMETMNQDSWELNRNRNLITQNSMNYQAITEAGILDFGLVKREMPDDTEGIIENIISTTGGSNSAEEDALTEFRLRVLEVADAESITAPEIDDPLIEINLGTKVTNDGQIVETDNTHAATSDGASKEIMIQLKTKADQGFEFTVDKEGNLTVKVNGNVKVATEGDVEIGVTGDAKMNVGGDAEMTVDRDAKLSVNGDAKMEVNGNIDASARNMKFSANDIKIAGNGKEKAVVLETFLDRYNMHTHEAPNGPTGVPDAATPVIPGSHISKITKMG